MFATVINADRKSPKQPGRLAALARADLRVVTVGPGEDSVLAALAQHATVVIIPAALGNEATAKLCARFRSAAVPPAILVIGPKANEWQAERLNAGADAVLADPSDALLVAEVTALARARARITEAAPPPEQLQGDARLAAIVESSDDAIFSKDLLGVIQTWNAGAEALLGYSASEIVGKPVTVLLPPERLVEEDDITWQLRLGWRVEHLETVRLAKDGRRIDVSVTSSPIKDASGRVVGTSNIVRDISQRKRAELTAHHAEEPLRAAAMTSETGMWCWTPATAELTVTENWRWLFGVGEGQAVTYETWRDAVHPDDRDRAAAELNAVATEGREFTLEYRIVRPDGTTRWLMDRGRASYDSNGRVRVAGVNVDVTERKRAEEAMERTAAILAHAGRMANLGAWEMELAKDGLNSNALNWSDQVYRIFGYEPGEVQVTDALFFERVHPDDRERVSEALADALAQHRPYSIEHRIVRPDGSERIVYEHADITFDAQGRPRRIVGAVQDITDRKRVELALREANERLAEADRRKDEFIALLSHELRNPLAPIRYAFPVLQRERLGESASRAVAVINRQVTHLTRLVDDLLDVSRITRGKLELRQQRVPLSSIVSDAVEAASPAIATAAHHLEVDIAPEPVWLWADSARVTQAVTNLLNNAAKYTPRGGRIEVKAGREDAQAVVRVRDTGIGIPAEQLCEVFDMFRQVHRQDKSQGGLGIGLTLARRLVEMHGGTIEARSDGVGRGAEFIMRLPIAPEEDVAAAKDPRPTPSAEHRLKVLVVDDNTDLVDMLAMLVRDLGHDVRTAFDGQSAVAMAREYVPDVVLLDIGLPVMNGIEVARELKGDPLTARATLVALTGWGQSEDRRQTASAGFAHHLTKPTDPERLERLLAELAGNGATRN